MTKHQLHEVKVPDEDEYKGFGAWVDYTIGDVTETEIEILFREGEMRFVVNRWGIFDSSFIGFDLFLRV